jgi:hypothetical protein
MAKRLCARYTLDDFYWRVLDVSIRDLVPKIAKTVAQLVELGFLEEKVSSDGKIFYQASPRYLSILQQRASPDA